jgi:hypothetical protein
MAIHDAKLLTGDSMRLRLLWGAVCLAGLVLWYREELQSITWVQGGVLILSLSSVTCAEVFLAPHLKHRAGVTILLAVSELVFVVWLAWLLPNLGH